MASLKLYSLGFAVANGNLLVEEQELDLTRTTNSVPVHTVASGYAGESPGSAMVEFDVQNAIPSAGFEFDAGPYMAGLIPIPVQFIFAGKRMKSKAFIVGDVIRHGVDQQARYSFRGRMPLAQFQT